jgi:diguanylate cyclase (GGDEF)-like protein
LNFSLPRQLLAVLVAAFLLSSGLLFYSVTRSLENVKAYLGAEPINFAMQINRIRPETRDLIRAIGTHMQAPDPSSRATVDRLLAQTMIRADVVGHHLHRAALPKADIRRLQTGIERYLMLLDDITVLLDILDNPPSPEQQLILNERVLVFENQTAEVFSSGINMAQVAMTEQKRDVERLGHTILGMAGLFLLTLSALVITLYKLLVQRRILQTLATTDKLTGLFNRREFDDRLEREWQRHLRNKQPLSLIMGDIDYFKSYNDLHGHTTGDDCLSRIGAVLRDSLGRSGDFAARYGGEEFVLVLPETSAQGALRVAEAVQQAVRGLAIPHRGVVIGHVTVSLGIATEVPQIGRIPRDLIDTSDLALYLAKSNGRNRIEVAENDTHL